MVLFVKINLTLFLQLFSCETFYTKNILKIPRKIDSEMYSEPSRESKKELFREIGHDF